MTERNICVEAKCKAACCSNIKLNGVSENELDRSFPVRRECAPSEFGIDNLRKGKGVYFADTGYLPDRPYEVQIVRRCPNVGEDYYCKLGNGRPAPCKNFAVGCDDCSHKRAGISLEAVGKDLVNEARRIESLKDSQEYVNINR
jgi:hypothetical protein